MQTKLLDHLVACGNKSGVLKTAPAGLRTMKEAIENVPFEVEVPGMSAVMTIPNMVDHLVDQIETLGSISAVGDFRNILGRVSSVDLASAIASATSVDELREAVGDVGALMAALKRYG
jgi:hypothetical protein